MPAPVFCVWRVVVGDWTLLQYDLRHGRHGRGVGGSTGRVLVALLWLSSLPFLTDDGMVAR